MTPSKKLAALERHWVGKRVSVVLHELPEKRRGKLVALPAEQATLTCLCDTSCEDSGDRRRRAKPTGTAMVRLDRPAKQLEYEVPLKNIVLHPKTQ